MDCTVHGVAKNQTQLSSFHCSFQVPCISDIVQYLSFSVWLISLSIMPSKSTQFAVNSLTIFLPWVLARAKREREEEGKLAAPDQRTDFSRCLAWSHTCLTGDCGHAGLRGMVWDSLLSCCVIWSPSSPSVAQSCLNLRDPMDCSTPSPWVCSNSCPSSQWCHPTTSSSVIPFSSCPQSFPASRSFPMSQFFASGGQSIGASTLASVLPMSIRVDFL